MERSNGHTNGHSQFNKDVRNGAASASYSNGNGSHHIRIQPHPSNAEPSSTIHNVINRQLDLMAEQLRLLRGVSGSDEDSGNDNSAQAFNSCRDDEAKGQLRKRVDVRNGQNREERQQEGNSLERSDQALKF